MKSKATLIALFCLFYHFIFSQQNIKKNDFMIGIGMPNKFMFSGNQSYLCYDQISETLNKINGQLYPTSSLNVKSEDSYENVFNF